MTCENWICVDDELPPQDGIYLVTNYPRKSFDIDFGVLEYDGYGFTERGIYFQPKFWKHPGKTEKKYGKVKNDL